jgi:hypothetical protein
VAPPPEEAGSGRLGAYDAELMGRFSLIEASPQP